MIVVLQHRDHSRKNKIYASRFCKKIGCVALTFVIIICTNYTLVKAQTDPVRNYSSKTRVENYNRPGSTNGWGFSAGYSAEFLARCTSGGSWNKSARGICYQAGSDSCSCNTGCDSDSCSISWGTRYANTGDFSISRIQPCNNSTCLDERTDNPGSVNDPEIQDVKPDDPMRALMPGGDGYIEFEEGLDGEGGGGIHWLSHSGSPDKYLMIPTKGQDYRSMIQGANTSTLTVENACMPASFSSSCPSAPRCSCSCSPCPDPDPDPQ